MLYFCCEILNLKITVSPLLVKPISFFACLICVYFSGCQIRYMWKINALPRVFDVILICASLNILPDNYYYCTSFTWEILEIILSFFYQNTVQDFSRRGSWRIIGEGLG